MAEIGHKQEKLLAKPAAFILKLCYVKLWRRAQKSIIIRIRFAFVPPPISELNGFLDCKYVRLIRKGKK
jgi:hypothetical protein